MDLKQLTSSLEQIAEEKNIPYETVLETVETALAAAYKKDYGDRSQNIRIELNPDTGAMQVYQVFDVVDDSMIYDVDEEAAFEDKEESSSADASEGEEKRVRFNPQRHIMEDEAQAIDPESAAGSELLVELDTPADFGRIAAQTAKQVIIQRLREAERDSVYDEYKDKEDTVVSGVMQRMEGNAVFVDIGRAIGVLYPDEQIPGERYNIGDRFRVYVVRVDRGTRGATIVLSRRHDKLVSRLFAIEVPEVSAGTVDIKAIAREPGLRSKVAVWTEEDGVDPVGSLVGQKGTRVQTVISELGGEKIDIIEWDPDEAVFIAHALSPAKVLYVDLDTDFRSAIAVVEDDQLSLAIGQRGQNVRLAAKLTGWRIDIKTADEVQEISEQKKKELRGQSADDAETVGVPDITLEDLPGIGAKTAQVLEAAGYGSIAAITAATADDLAEVDGIGAATAEKIMEALEKAHDGAGGAAQNNAGENTESTEDNQNDNDQDNDPEKASPSGRGDLEAGDGGGSEVSDDAEHEESDENEDEN